MAASLPLGSINPISNSYIDNLYPSFNYADVPPMVAALLDTLKNTVLGLI